MWGQLKTNKSVGGLFLNDGDGNAWGDKQVGFPPVLDKLGYKLTDPGRYQNLTDDFTAQIAAFKKAECDIITGVVLPPDFTTFWNQALQQGLKPKIASVGKAVLFPSAVEALGRNGNNLSSEVWWTPPSSIRVVADWTVGQGGRRRLRTGLWQTVDATDRVCALVVRSCRRRDEAHLRRWRQ
jgi:ABC-type branched-subunit amino acid transport system substrate-binding protein